MEKTITDFLEDDFSSSALYLSYRSLPSVADGLKQSHRKAVYTIKKKNIKDRQKVSQFGPLVAAETDYLHGDISIIGAITTLAQDYAGTNNLPLLVADGNFGTRFSHDPSAPRYIFTYPQKYFNSLFRKEDDCNLITQIFEGGVIEPRFYTPTLPMVLVNGCTGIGVGFASKILPRDPKSMIKVIKATLDGKKVNNDWFKPSFKCFTGSVEGGADNKWFIKGAATLKGTKLTITEIPVSYSLSDYLTILKKLKEKEVIVKYSDSSEDDKFKFEVVLSATEAVKDLDTIMMDLKLIVPFTESLTCLDENNAITEYDNPKAIFDAYYKIKISYMEKRILSEMERLTKEAASFKEVYSFIKDVIDGRINLKLKKAEVEKQIKARGYVNVEKLLNMPLISITEERAAEAKSKWEAKEAELEAMKHETPSSLWKKDLDELEKLI